jgi:O-succinylbenzoic acid--CoA ligase
LGPFRPYAWLDGPIWIPTGGSSGNLRFAGHTWATLTAAVQGFCEHFADYGTDPVSAYCVLPLYHVSGLMQALRCWHTGGTLWVQSFRALQQGGPLPGQAGFLSLVPTQLQRLLMAERGDWLRQFRGILLGGAPPWPTLLARSRQLQLPLAPTYGMTETAAQVATLLPSEFLAGQSGSGRSLPHVQLTLCDDAGRGVPSGQVGLITLSTLALAATYSTGPLMQPFQPGDRGYLDGAGVLHVVGRADHLILTGGEKVQPEEVEAALLATGRVRDAVVVGVPDRDWGEVVVALWVPLDDPDPRPLQAQLRQVLSPYKCPKHWLVWDLQRSAQGKVNRAQLRSQARRQLDRGGDR